MGNNLSATIRRRNRLGWGLLALGFVLILTGVGIRIFAPDSAVNPKWLESFGIFLVGCAAAFLVKVFQALKDPLAARRAVIEEQDERRLSIRNRAGNAAFIFSMGTAYLALMIYSLLSSSRPGFDPLWLYLAFAVLGPGAVYVICLIHYNQKY
jgi:uncharacterized membrane protein